MLILNNVKLPLDFNQDNLFSEAARKLKIEKSTVKSVSLYRRSVDARDKQNVHFCCSLLVEISANEAKVLGKCKDAQRYNYEPYVFKKVSVAQKKRPVIVGFGPAGMFAAYTLAKAGLCPIVIERGQAVDDRIKTVTDFMNGGALNTESNVQFGEGGAGTFSDGKLNTGIKNVRCRTVLETFVECGANPDILIDAKPHIGTDCLVKIVKNIRKEIISLGGEVHFNSRLTTLKQEDGRLCQIGFVKDGCEHFLECEHLILAIGHSARDTFLYLKNSGIPLERKTFSMGARIEHKRADIDRALYGSFATHPSLGAADYKLATHLENGKGVYTFCMCPGGQVINASSEENQIAVNGMSLSLRDGENSNSALLVDIRPEELDGQDVLEGMYLQRRVEKAAFSIGNGAVPIQSVGSLLGVSENTLGDVLPTVKPQTVLANIYDVLPREICDGIAEGIKHFSKKIKGFDSPDALLTFPETRSSSPIRIIREENGCSAGLFGLYPTGEGAGYAGGIMSAAVDGIKAAEALIANLEKKS